MSTHRTLGVAFAATCAVAVGAFAWQQASEPGARRASDAASAKGARATALAPGTGAGEASSHVAVDSSGTGTGTESGARAGAKRADARESGATPPPEAPVRPKESGPPLPGSSALYSGALLRNLLVPAALAPGASADKKAQQLERSQDVADKRGTIVGAIERVTAKEIAGWAYAWDDPATPAAVSVFVDGVFVATVPSSAARSDAAAVDPANPASGRGWSCPAPASLGDGDKHVVVALGSKQGSPAQHALQNSPWAYGGVQFPQGAVLYASDRLVYGWASDPAQPGAPVSVTLSGDGAKLGQVATLGAGHDADVFQQALALAPSQRVEAVIEGATGPDDPNLPALADRKVQALAAGESHAGPRRWTDVRPLADVRSDPNVAWDEIDFFLTDAQGNATPLPALARAGIKFAKLDESQPAFVFAPAQPIVAGWLQARASSADGSLDRELSGSPVQLGASANRLPYGAVVFVNDVQISGWAVDPDALPGTIAVDVFVDGSFVQRLQADRAFAALTNSVPLPDANHAFTFSPPDRFKDGKTHSVQFFAVNQPEGMNPELPGSPTTFVGKRNASPFGWLDAVSLDAAAGWAYDPDAGSAPTSVEVWVDDQLWKTAPANVSRPDLVPIVTAEPEHGFQVPLPSSVKDGKHHTIRVFGLDSTDGPKQELAGSPKELNAQSPFFGVSLSDGSQGVTITGVVPGSPAAVGGLVGGDVIRASDGNTTVDVAAFVAWAKTKEVGEQVVFRVWHDPASAPAPAASPVPAPAGTAPLGSGQRFVVVTVGSR